MFAEQSETAQGTPEACIASYLEGSGVGESIYCRLCGLVFRGSSINLKAFLGQFKAYDVLCS